MSLVFSSSTLIPSSCFSQCKVFSPKFNQNSSVTQFFPIFRQTVPLFINEDVSSIFRKKVFSIFRHTAIDCVEPTYQFDGQNDVSLDFGDEEKEEDEVADSPWEGALIYKRSSSTTHVEYCTTLERLGLGKLSTEVSKSRASEMGIRVTKAVKDYPFGTPVQVSVDVTKKKKRLRLDGIVKTVISLGCNRCGDPAAKSIFSDFSLLLTDEPVEEPDVIDMGMIYGEDKNKAYTGIGKDGDEDDDTSIDFEDRLYFPSGEKEIDISKHIRDLVHLEINIDAVCGPNCKGFCFKCGTNLNTGICNCSEQVAEKTSYGPLGNLKEKMQAK